MRLSSADCTFASGMPSSAASDLANAARSRSMPLWRSARSFFSAATSRSSETPSRFATAASAWRHSRGPGPLWPALWLDALALLPASADPSPDWLPIA